MLELGGEVVAPPPPEGLETELAATEGRAPHDNPGVIRLTVVDKDTPFQGAGLGDGVNPHDARFLLSPGSRKRSWGICRNHGPGFPGNPLVNL